MQLKSIIAVLAIAAMPVCAQAQSMAPKPTKASAQKVVATISADKAKVKIYCDMGKLGDQIEAADKKKDTKTADALAKQMDEMSKQLGPEYAALMDELQDMDPNSKEGQDIGSSLDALDKMCGK
ncbi:MAG: hypothetical protein ACREB2_08990 [Pseudolabrys sp.]